MLWRVRTGFAGVALIGMMQHRHSRIYSDAMQHQKPGSFFIKPKLEQEWKQIRFSTSIALRMCYLGCLYVPTMMLFPIWYFMNRNRFSEDQYSMWWLKLFRFCLEQSGPLYIKLGQWLSSRTDILPLRVCQVFATLQSSVQPHALEHTHLLIENDLGASIGSLFDEFDPVPIGVGAVAQVYKAKLKNSQQKVAIKVLHPHVRDILEMDFVLLNFMGRFLHSLPIGLQYLGIPQEIKTFERMMMLQTDLLVEGANLGVFQRNFTSNQNVQFPKWIKQYSTKEVLIETYMEGCPLQKFLEFESSPFDHWIAETGFQAFVV
jgi:aarF domain-containing kinase